MTMHLVRYLSTTRTKKSQGVKMTRARREQLERDLKLKNKGLRQRGEPQMSFDQYVAWVTGTTPKYKSDTKSTFNWTASSSPRAAAAKTASIASHTSTMSDCTKSTPKTYTGTLLKGIATMHKSNAVPVIDEQHMKDISSMRR